MLDQPRYLRLSETFGEAIDRLAQSLEAFAAFFQHMIRMDDLQHVAEAFQPARHPARFAHRQLLFRCVGRAPEIGQREDIADPILRQHPIGRARTAAGAMLGDGQLDDDLLALARLVDIADRASGHEAFGQVIIEIAYSREAKASERFLQLRADAFERLRLGKQRIEYLGAHGHSINPIVIPAEAGTGRQIFQACG